MPHDSSFSLPESPNGYCLRLATAGDLVSISGLMRDYFNELGLEFDPDGLDRDLADPEAEYATGVLIVIERDGLAVGCAALRRVDSATGEIKRMYLSPEHRGRGLGELLLEAVLRMARSGGFSRLVLDTRRDLEAANALYERFGFEDIIDYNQNPRAERFLGLWL